MNHFFTAANLNKALVTTGLDPKLATLTETSPATDVWGLCYKAGSTPAKVTELAESLHF
ncbi:hypothetical protein [Pseudarthrobacter sulfonivorans]|uniref:hypothetical protein n=1 Tax=Pseudarthrobacter sulfonivorans TaxID=121292 RepID=UPI0012FDF098|nr:hypothetical protein [Pseudarthrobacter sulfonivorans]